LFHIKQTQSTSLLLSFNFTKKKIFFFSQLKMGNDKAKKKKNYHLLMFDISEPDQETVSSSHEPYGFHNDSIKSCSNGSSQKVSTATTAQTSFTNKPKKRVRKLKKIPRPPNSFILYRKAKQNDVIAQNKNLTLAGVSKVIAKMWREENEEERFQWSILADRAKLKHTQDYPDYVYRPKRSVKKPSTRKPRTKKRKSAQHKSDKSTSGGSSGCVTSSTVGNKSDHSMPHVSNVPPPSPDDRSTTHGVLHDHWSNHHTSSTNHMTFHQQRHYAQTPEVFDIIPHENFISQCFNPVEATSYISPNALRIDNFAPFPNAKPVDKFPYFTSHITSPHATFSFNNFDTTSVDHYVDKFNSTNEKLFYYNNTTASSSSTIVEDMETYFDESVSSSPTIVEDVKDYYEYCSIF
jgi:hypothetical protein